MLTTHSRMEDETLKMHRPESNLWIVNPKKARVICHRAMRAGTFVLRLKGLLCSAPLRSGEGLLIDASAGIHTFGMRYPVDVVALDSEYRILSIRKEVLPWRVAGVSWRTRRVLELPAGAIDQCDLEVGDVLQVGGTRERVRPTHAARPFKAAKMLPFPSARAARPRTAAAFQA